MASLKIKYRHSSIEGKAGTLFYQVIHNRVARQINSGYKIYPDEWDIFNSQIIIPAKTGENRHRYLVSLKKCIEEDTSRLKDIMIRFENLGYKYTADEIIEYYWFFVKFGGNLFFISMVFLFFFLNPIKSCRYVCFLVTLKTPHH